MTSKEIVKRSLSFNNPEYRPLMYYGTDRIEKSDAVSLFVENMYGGEDGRTTEWGFKWKDSDGEFKLGIVQEPII